MATVIRLSRQGRRNRPHYRVGVFDERTRRDGAPHELVGDFLREVHAARSLPWSARSRATSSRVSTSAGRL